MAVVKMNQIKTTLAKSVRYIADPGKTRGGALVSSNYSDDVTDAGLLADRMMRTLDDATTARRADGVLAHHVIQSFSPEDSARLTPERLHELGVRFADEITGGEYQYVIATHVDRGHTHNHIIICAASQLTGRRMRVRKDTLARWRTVSDRISLEEGLTVLPDRPRGQRYGVSLAELYASAKGDAVKTRIRAVIDMAAAGSHDFDSFRRLLGDHGVRAAVRGRHLTFHDTASGMKVRDVRLGRAYDELNIMARIGRGTVTAISFNRRLVARRDGDMLLIWVPGTGRRQTIAVPATRVVRDGDTYRAYLPKADPVTVMDGRGRYACRMDTGELHAHFAPLPIRSMGSPQSSVPESFGRSPAHRRWLEMRERQFAQLDELTDRLNLASRLARRGLTVAQALAEADRRLQDAHDAFQATLVALDETASQHDGTVPADLLEELKRHEARVEALAHERDLLRSLDMQTSPIQEPPMQRRTGGRHRTPDPV